MTIDRRLLTGLDWTLVAVTLMISGIGVLTIASVTRSGPGAGLYLKQLSMLGAGLVAMLLTLGVDYRRLVDRAPLLYIAGLGALLAVLFVAPVVAGTQRWFVLGGVRLQPSEFVKLIVALLVAKVFSESRKESLGLLDLIGPGAAVGLLVVLIAAQPDLGTAVCLLPIFFTVAFLGGLRPKAIAWLALAMLVLGGLGWQFALRDYQKERIYTFLDPSLDPKGGGYQKIQSEIAVGSGGLLGKGFGQGSQSQLGYLPARQTDFIFSVLAEELGFVGVAMVLSLYLVLLWRALDTALVARDRAGALLVAGITAALTFQVVYNVAMVAGLVPVKGLPLPLMSYGGSSLLSSLLGVGLILNVRMRRFAN
jgi:rod shape determining protein RodA